MKKWVEAQTESGRYSNASDYVRDHIRHDQERSTKIGELQKRVEEGLLSGVSERNMSEIFDAARQQS